MLNPQSPLPLYHQLADIILAKIRSGEYSPGSRIPAEHSLAATYGIGRPTARQAIDLLVRKRRLTKRRGSGTYVCEKKKDVGLFSLDGTQASFYREGLSVTTRILQKMRLQQIESDVENPFSDSKAYFFSRLTRVDRVPVLIENMFLHATLFTGIDEISLSGRSVSEVVEERFYMRPTRGRQNFRIGFLNDQRAAQIDISPSTPVLVVKRFLDFPQADNAFFSELFCRTDQFVFSQTLGGTADG
jgi:GntR family transcriptional regulator